VFSGEVPFKHEKSDYSVVLRIVKGERPSRPAHTELSDAVWRLLERSWDANIQQRPVIMEYFKVLGMCIPGSSSKFGSRNLSLFLAQK
jgi:hypothetical protein